MRICNLFLIFLLAAAPGAFAIDTAKVSTPAHAKLSVRVIDLRNSKGVEVCTLFGSSAANVFPDDVSAALRTVTAPVQFGAATCEFADIPQGTYAVVTFHDENNNGQFDRDSLGLPKEEYGFSNSLRPRFERPKFKEAAFEYKGGDQWLTIHIAN
ncbi:MAG TPA: DUF2141 domain-containing protein [Candidatus Binataceae bacterium]|nr:DUF2141 domain-containing protein [Candidatus Binataceae bacterium]